MGKESTPNDVLDIPTSLRAWRVSVLNALLVVTSIAAGPMMLVVILAAGRKPEQWPAALTFLAMYLCVVGLTVLRRLDFHLRAWGLLLMVYSTAALAFARGGLAGDGRIYLLALPMLTLILIGWHASLTMAALSLLTFATFAVTAHLGWMAEWLVCQDNPLLLIYWVEEGIAFLLTLAVLMTTQYHFNQFQEATSAKHRQTGKKLREYRDHLEELVEQRSAELVRTNEQLEQKITEQEQAEKALRWRNRELALLNQASHAFSSTLDLDQVLTTVLEEARRRLGAVACSIWLIDPETDELVCQQSIGPKSEVVRGWRLAPKEGLVGWVTHTGESIIVPDTQTDERYFEGVDQQTGLKLRSILSVPLRTKDNVIGVLQATATEPDRFTTADLTLLEPLAAPAAIAIDNAGLVETLRQRTVELQARNEELDAFAHTVAHDLKNPLARVVGFAEILTENHHELPDAELLRYLRMIALNGRKMDSIISELLLLAVVRKLEEVEIGPLDMAHIVAEAMQRLYHEIAKSKAQIILPETWPVASGYGPWVEEVWVNYLSNALNYGGRAEKGIPPRIELGFNEWTNREMANGATRHSPFAIRNSFIRFWVRDNGSGLTPEEQARLFAPLTRLSETHIQGHGLGLSIVRRVVEKLGGQVGVESEIGRGSLFFFTLPIG